MLGRRVMFCFRWSMLGLASFFSSLLVLRLFQVSVCPLGTCVLIRLIYSWELYGFHVALPECWVGPCAVSYISVWSVLSNHLSFTNSQRAYLSFNPFTSLSLYQICTIYFYIKEWVSSSRILLDLCAYQILRINRKG